MDLYQGCIDEVKELLAGRRPVCLPYRSSCWPEAEKTPFLFASDTAVEPGGGNLPAVGVTLCTDHAIGEDTIDLLGKDLQDLSGNVPYGRIALVEIEAPEEDKDLYDRLRKVEYTRYRLRPEGVMMRVSSMDHRECMRISKEAEKNGISFRDLGKNMLARFHEIPCVKAARILYITDPSFPFAPLSAIGQKAKEITLALDHLVHEVHMDCDTCGFRKVCDQVADLYEKEFGRSVSRG